jgi:hypothetical protein
VTNTQLLVGSLSNDLFRVATLTERGSVAGAARFLLEAKRWAGPLSHQPVAAYIVKIAQEIHQQTSQEITLAQAERYLMYSILLQNYSLHHPFTT